jgi:hypothetical protein
MKKLTCVVIVWVAIAVTGCNAVFSPHPMGEKPVPLVREEWEGTWIQDDGFLVIKVLDSEKGLLRLAWIEADGELKYETRDIQMRATGEFLFANLKEKEFYTWAKAKKEKDRIIAWVPDLEKLRALVKEGKLPGKIDNNSDIYLDDLAPEHVQMITSESEGVLFDWENPGVAIRTAK